MPIILSDAGLQLALLSLIRPGDVSTPDWEIRLFVNNLSLNRSTPLGNFVEASFSGYDSITLDPNDWPDPVMIDDRAQSDYEAGILTWDNTGVTTQTVYGFYVVDLTLSDWVWAEKFATPRTMAPTAHMIVNPKLYERNDPSPP